MKEDKSAVLAELIYHNDDNYYTVAVFETEEEQFFAVGSLVHPNEGRSYRLTGEWKTHPKYGLQFAFSSFEEEAPSTAEGILAFLSSGVIKGVGPAAAAKLVRAFGSKTLEVIEKTPQRLTEVQGIGPAKAAAICEGYEQQRGYASVVMALARYDIPAKTALNLYKQYGAQTVATVEENPYRLIDDVWGIGFRKADAIAKKIGISEDSVHRLRSGLLYALEESAANGSTYEEKAALLERTAQLLDVPREKLEEALFSLIMDTRLYADTVDGREVVMLYRYYRAERRVAARLYALCHAELTHINADAEKLIRASEKQSGMQFSERQKNAILSSLKNGVSIITGGPGTGKTTILNTILKILDAAGVPTALAAPTGRAAKRMEEATGQHAQTIHRLLEYSYSEDSDEMHFSRDAENPLDYRCIIIDETSMVDILLMEGLLEAIKPGSRLILVGDADQLPPVGAGNVLKDMLEGGYIHAVRLTEIFRQAQESLIIVNAHRINRGEHPSWNEKGKDFFLLERGSERDILATIRDLCTRRLPAYLNEATPDAIQVLTPTRKGLLGSIELNRVLQEALNPPAEDKPEKTIGSRTFRVGDRVMQNKNDYQLGWRSLRSFEESEGVFNGDLGIVRSVDNDKGTVSVLFDGDRLAVYDYSIIDELEPAFAMTVHKSQGSEFAAVVMPMTRFPSLLATRNLLYTAVTRAKQLVVLVGNPAVCGAMVDNNTVEDRNSGLADRLRKLWDFDEG